MPSLSTLTPISKNKDVTPDDVNIIYNILTGKYSTSRGSITETTKRGLGISVQLTGYDGRLSTGLIDVSRYALEVRNRETTVQKTFAARRADNKIVFAVEGGLAYAVKDTNSATLPTQVIVHGTPAGGILSGTYPNPGGTEYNTIYPTMIVAWYGSSSTTLRSGNLEVTDAPGWVFCNAATGTVTLRSGATLAVPDMTDRLPIGVGTVAAGTTAGHTWGAAGAVSIAHGHTIAAHTHGVTGTHSHGLNFHVHSAGAHTHPVPDHAHTMNGHTHGMASHTHDISGHTHSMLGHVHDISGHWHSGPDHQHSGASLGVTGSTGIANQVGTGSGSSAPPPSFSEDTHTHGVGNLDVSGNTNFAGTGGTSGSSASNTGGPSSASTGTSSSLTTATPAPGSTDGPSFVNTSTASGIAATAGSGNTGAPADTSVTTAASSGTTDNNSVGTSTASQTTLSAINVRPPVLAWHWILKL